VTGGRVDHAGGMPPTATIESITDDAFGAEVLEAGGPVLVDFTAAWCPPCRVMKPVLAELAAERPDLRIVQVDVDANQRTAAAYGVLSMPTFILFRGGQPIAQLVGARPKSRLARELDRALEGVA
jgi:thioredoxin 1